MSRSNKYFGHKKESIYYGHKKIIYHRNEQIENFSYNESPTGYGKEAQGSSP